MQSILKPIAALSVAGALMLQTSPTHAADPAKTSFEEVSVKLDPNGHLYAYMNTAKVMKQMDQMVESLLKIAKEGGDDSILNNPLFGPMISNLMEAIKPAYDESGVSQISGVGMSSFAVKEDLWRSKMYVHRSSQEGDGLIWKMLGKAPHELDVLELAPEDTGLIAHSDLDINALIDWIDRISSKLMNGQSFSAEMPAEAKDILNSYDGEVGLLMTLDPDKKLTLPGFMFQMEEDIEMDSFAFALLLRAKDDKILTMINDAMASGLAPPQKTKVGLITLHSIPLPMPIPIPGLDISPCYFQVDDYIVFASSSALGKDIIQAKNGKGRLTDNPEFKSVTNGIDLNANGITYASASSVAWAADINELSMGEMPDSLKKTFQIYLDYTKTMKGMVSLIKSDNDGVLIETHSNVNMFGEYMVHTLASIAITVANSLQQFNDSGMFEDLGGFDEGPDAFNEPLPEPGLEPAPAGKLAIAHWVKGEEVDLSKGVNVVEFWATWCPPCRTSIPHLTALQKRFKDQGVNIIGVSDEPLRTVEPFVKRMGDKMDYVVAIDDANSTSNEYMRRYGVNGIPHAFVVKDGTVVWHGHPMSGLDKAIDNALRGVAVETNTDHFEKFYSEHNIGEEYQLTPDDIVDIVGREDNRTKIAEELKFFKIEEFSKSTATINYFSPDGDSVPGPPPFNIKHKYVSGGHLVEEADLPYSDGKTIKTFHVITPMGDRQAFIGHFLSNGKITSVGLNSINGKSKWKHNGVGIHDDGTMFRRNGTGDIFYGRNESSSIITINDEVIIKEKVSLKYE